MVSGVVDNLSYHVYVFFGKLSKPKIRMTALSHAFRMEKVLNSKKKLAILSTGGVLRNKKLQKGSTLSLLANAPAISKEVSDFSDVHIFSFFLKE